MIQFESGCRGWWRSVGVAAAFMGLLTTGAAGQELPAVLMSLEGSWVGTGQLFDRPASFTMSWDLQSASVAVLSFTNGMVTEDGSVSPILESTAVYRAGADSIRGVWIDSRNERVELSAQAGDSVLTTEWRSSSENGRTEYRLNADGTVEVEDQVQTDDGWRVFGTALYERASAGG